MHENPIDIIVNGTSEQSHAETLLELIEIKKLDYTKIATALNGEFIPIGARKNILLKQGDRIEFLSVRQGG